MKTETDLIPIATTSDGLTIYYSKRENSDGIVKLNGEEIVLSLADYFFKRTDISPIEETEEQKNIWKNLRIESGAKKS